MKDDKLIIWGARIYFAWAMLVVALYAVLMFFAATQASAQVMTVPLPSCADRTALSLPLPTAATPVCLPKELGGPATSIVEMNSNGGAVAWYCSPTSLHLYAVRWSSLEPSMATDFWALATASDKRAAIQTMLDKHQTANIWDMCDVWGMARDRINAAVPAAAVWSVARYSLQTTRPAYPVINGVRGTTSTSRALVGAVCDCTTPLREGLTTYCPFTGSASSVAICTQQP